MTDKELEAVIAHEIGHIRHSDMFTNMHVAVAIAGLGGIYEIGKAIASYDRGYDDDDDDDEDSGSLATLGLAMMAGGMVMRLTAYMLQLAMSRTCEYDADRVAAELCGSAAMISALQTLQDVSDGKKAVASSAFMGVRPGQDAKVGSSVPALSSYRGGAFAHACISDGEKSKEQKKEDGWQKVTSAFRTHPTTEKRITALKENFVLPPSKK